MTVLQQLNKISQSNGIVNRIAVEITDKPNAGISSDGVLNLQVPPTYDLLTVSENCAEFNEYVGTECTKYQILVHKGALYVDVRSFQPQGSFT